jgi:hypothetical protein
MNMAVQMLDDGHSVGFASLDEPVWSYVLKFMSVMFGLPTDYLQENWDSKVVRELKDEYLQRAHNLSLTSGYWPTMDHLTAWLDTADATGSGARPDVVFIDYFSLLRHDGDGYGGEIQRIQYLAESLRVWVNENDVAAIAIHQVGRGDKKYDGSTPMTPEYLKYGGEEVADLIFSTYRPAKDQLGQLDMTAARTLLKDKFDEESWQEARSRVKRYWESTFLQLLKNRPGTHTDYEGIELRSIGESQRMVPADEAVEGSKLKVVKT